MDDKRTNDTIIVVDTMARIDKYLAENSSFSRSMIQKFIDNKQVFVDNRLVRKANFIVKNGAEIAIRNLPLVPNNNPKLIAENIPLDIIYEDDDIVIINKAQGMVVHPSPGHHNSTLVNALLHHFTELSATDDVTRPGIVHRIDKDTSGLLMVAKNNLAHQFLAQELKKHHIKRTYYALVAGILQNNITHIDLPIGRDTNHRQKMQVKTLRAKQAITHVYVEKVLTNQTLVRCELETGRTHQIRVHLSHIGHPIIGDPIYGHKIDELGQRLHAGKLEIIHPRTKEIMHFLAPDPAWLKDAKS